MADQGQEAEGTREGRGGLVRRIWRQVAEHTKLLLAALLVMVESDLFRFMTIAFVGFYFANLVVREADENVARFAIFGVFFLLSLPLIYVYGRKLIRRIL